MECFIAICKFLDSPDTFDQAVLELPEASLEVSDGYEIEAMYRRGTLALLWQRMTNQSLCYCVVYGTYECRFAAQRVLAERVRMLPRMADEFYKHLFCIEPDGNLLGNVIADCVWDHNWDKLKDIARLRHYGIYEGHDVLMMNAGMMLADALLVYIGGIVQYGWLCGTQAVDRSLWRPEPTITVAELEAADICPLPFMYATHIDGGRWFRHNPIKAKRWFNAIDDPVWHEDSSPLRAEIEQRCRPITLFALVVLICDGYFDIDVAKTNTARFWRIVTSLPFDLQPVLCARIYGFCDTHIVVPEPLWRTLFFARKPIFLKQARYEIYYCRTSNVSPSETK